jgi:MYXO-CTERM domain-containing protein
MKRTLAFSAALAMGMVSSAALAAPNATYKWADGAAPGMNYKAPDSAAVSHVIYLNNCKPNGCQLSPGYDNAPQNTSSIPDQSSTVSAYTGSDATWNSIVQCVRQTYADFDVQIVTERPTSGNYHMAIVAGSPSNVQQSSGVMGVSPFSCGYISNSISFTFANLDPSNVADLCWTVAQETAHSWGLDHKYDNRDPMTYLSGGPTYKRYQNEAGSCGEYSARSCSCNYSSTPGKMNSYALIMSTFGSNTPDTVPPTVQITYPTEGAQVTAGFPVQSTVNDDRNVDKVEFKLDGMSVGMKTDPPFNFQAPSNLGQGKHVVEVTGYDHAGNATKATVNVQFGSVCTKDSECTTAGNVCVEGHCVAGPSSDGGLGTECTGNADCNSGQCGSDGTHSYCVTACDPAMNACPGGFSCQDTGNGAGVCWPADGGGGGCSTGGDGHGALLLMLGFVGILVTRRRR